MASHFTQWHFQKFKTVALAHVSSFNKILRAAKQIRTSEMNEALRAGSCFFLSAVSISVMALPKAQAATAPESDIPPDAGVLP